MAPSTLDLLFLTFNCGKALVSTGAFAVHLQTAFEQNATSLPEVVVLSLQEVAPMSYAFVGDYFLKPYLARFSEAINLAAIRYDANQQHVGGGENDNLLTVTPTPKANKAYTLVRSQNVGYTVLMLYAKDPTRLRDLEDAEVGFGAAEMGNKGAVGLRVIYAADGGEETELTFVATHLAAMEWNLARRNANWAAIMRGLTFKNPETVMQRLQGSQAAAAAAAASSGIGEHVGQGERVRLLEEQYDEEHARARRELHEISVFKPSSHLFVGGDLNYRISTTSPPPYAAFPSMDPTSEHYYPTFFPLDQLTRERKAGRTLHGLTEAKVNFPPTYKYDVLPSSQTGNKEDDGKAEVPWKFAPHRYPSWTDRVLFLDIPTWVNDRSTDKDVKINVRAYDALPLMRTSDHRPVFLRVDVPLISQAEMMPPPELASVQPGPEVDPRVRLPIELDPEAWERRAAARRRELMAGWSMLFGSTKEGAYLLASLLAVGVGGYFLYRSVA